MKRLILTAALLLVLPSFAKHEVNNGYKVHGGNYTCADYETSSGLDQNAASTYGKLAAASYQDDGTAFGNTTTADAYKDTGYVPLTKSETEALLSKGLLAGSAITVGGTEDNPTISGANKDRLNAMILKKTSADGKTTEYVISYRGSKEAGDWLDDAKQVADKAGVIPQQYKDAAELFQGVLKATEAEGAKISCTGHSLGGGLVTYALGSVDYAGRDVKGYTYNAAGLSESTMNTMTNTKQAALDIVNIRNQLDPVSYVAYHLGETYEVESSAPGTKHTVEGDHGINALLDNMQAISDGTAVKGHDLAALAVLDEIADLVINGKVKTDGFSISDMMSDNVVAGAKGLAIAELENQIAAALPKDVADNVNRYLDMVLAEGVDLLDAATKQQLLDTIKAGIKEYVPYKGSAEKINGIIQDVFDGKETDALEAAKSLGTAIGVDSLKEAIGKSLDKDAAERINKLIDGYTQGGKQGLTDAALKEVNDLIDKNAPGKGSAEALKKTLDGISKGTATADDLKNTSTELLGDYAEKIIDKSKLDPSVKKAAKEAIAELKKNGISDITSTAQDFIENYVTDKLGEEAGRAAGDLFDAIATPERDVWEAILDDLPVIAKELGSKLITKFEGKIAEQIDKYVKRHPVLQEIFGAIGLDGTKIVNGMKNIWGIFTGEGSIVEKFKILGKNLVADLKVIAVNILKWGLNKLSSWLNNLANKVLDKIIAWVTKLAGGASNSLVKSALGWVKGHLESFKKKGAVSTLTDKLNAKAVNWVREKMKSKPAEGEKEYNGVFFGGKDEKNGSQDSKGK